MKEYTIRMNCRIEELTPEQQVAVINLIDHMASFKYSDIWLKDVVKRLKDICLEFPDPSDGISEDDTCYWEDESKCT